MFRLFCLLLFSTLIRSFTVIPELKKPPSRSSVRFETSCWIQVGDDDTETDIVTLPRRDKLLWSSKVNIQTTDAGSLQVFIPQIGISGSNLFEVGFTASWLGFIGFWTIGMLRAGAGLMGPMFSIPFWIAGTSMANQSLIEPNTTTQLTLGIYSWSLEKSLLGTHRIVAEGPTWQLDQARVDSEMEINGKPLTSIMLQSGTNVYSFGHGLTDKEKDWVALEINEWLKEHDTEINKAATETGAMS